MAKSEERKAALRASQHARCERKKAVVAAKTARLNPAAYTVECIRCGYPGPGRTFAKRVKVCNNCWADMTPTERRNTRGFAALVG